MKEYSVIQHCRRGRTKVITGDMEYLERYFRCTLECGNSWNSKIRVSGHKTGKSLVSDLNKSVDETQGGCYERDYYELGE